MYKDKIIIVPIYDQRVRFIATDCEETLKEKTGIESEWEGVFAFVCSGGIKRKGTSFRCFNLVLNPNYKYTKMDDSILVHEKEVL